ncbi:MAG TPA: hypothetical protein PLF42_01285 [Anaerolineales bacterium]|nr:hypothetical protein [Anaerolineales bacterium]
MVVLQPVKRSMKPPYGHPFWLYAKLVDELFIEYRKLSDSYGKI